MPYTALYRKFRPKDFEEVKGQEPIVTALRNQVRTGRIGHAYLFTGTRGTGKTTMAKIMAKAVNCEQPRDGSPCNTCASSINYLLFFFLYSVYTPLGYFASTFFVFLKLYFLSNFYKFSQNFP